MAYQKTDHIRRTCGRSYLDIVCVCIYSGLEIREGMIKQEFVFPFFAAYVIRICTRFSEEVWDDDCDLWYYLWRRLCRGPIVGLWETLAVRAIFLGWDQGLKVAESPLCSRVLHLDRHFFILLELLVRLHLVRTCTMLQNAQHPRPAIELA